MNDLEKIIVIDMDGTICSIDDDYSKCVLLEGAKEAIDKIRSKDFLIHIHTGRHILNSSLTINWLNENNIIYDHIVFGKPPAKYYIDDKGIEFDNWSSVLKKINL